MWRVTHPACGRFTCRSIPDALALRPAAAGAREGPAWAAGARTGAGAGARGAAGCCTSPAQAATRERRPSSSISFTLLAFALPYLDWPESAPTCAGAQEQTILSSRLELQWQLTQVRRTHHQVGGFAAHVLRHAPAVPLDERVRVGAVANTSVRCLARDKLPGHAAVYGSHRDRRGKLPVNTNVSPDRQSSGPRGSSSNRRLEAEGGCARAPPPQPWPSAVSCVEREWCKPTVMQVQQHARPEPPRRTENLSSSSGGKLSG